MSAFPDTSFLCALYVPLEHSHIATSWMARQTSPLGISPLALYEFRASARLQTFRWQNDHTQGFPPAVAKAALAKLNANMEAGALTLVSVDFADILDRAERLSAQHCASGGHRSMDVLHVATALHLRAKRFLTFDSRQRKLAQAAGLATGPG